MNRALKWFGGVTAEDLPDATLTVGRAIEDYIADLKIRKSPEAAKRAEQAGGKHILPQLGRLEVVKLSTKRLKAWQNNLVAESNDPETVRRSKDTANRVLTILKAALNLSFRVGSARDDTAWRRLSPFPDSSRAREVFLTLGQCTALLDACGPDFRQLVHSGLLTGARYSELTRRKVSDFDANQGVLHIQDGKTGSRTSVLSDSAIAHFKILTENKSSSAFLHYRNETIEDPATGDQKVRGVQWGKSDQARRIKSAVKIANAALEHLSSHIPTDTVFYSLRHSHISFALLAGVNIQVIAENCGTSVRMVEKFYGKFLRTDRRQQFNAVPLP